MTPSHHGVYAIRRTHQWKLHGHTSRSSATTMWHTTEKSAYLWSTCQHAGAYVFDGHGWH
uniref:Uncharacterized protein n=1 Tax=Arundo donax TaxID=35708 RepID=A0A0A9GBJ5_ARUDO